MNLFQRDATRVQSPPYLMKRIGGDSGPPLKLAMGGTRSKASYKAAGAKGGGTRMVMSFVKRLTKEAQ